MRPLFEMTEQEAKELAEVQTKALDEFNNVFYENQMPNFPALTVASIAIKVTEFLKEKGFELKAIGKESTELPCDDCEKYL